MVSIIRRMRTRLPTCLSIGLGTFIAILQPSAGILRAPAIIPVYTTNDECADSCGSARFDLPPHWDHRQRRPCAASASESDGEPISAGGCGFDVVQCAAARLLGRLSCDAKSYASICFSLSVRHIGHLGR